MLTNCRTRNSCSRILSNNGKLIHVKPLCKSWTCVCCREKLIKSHILNVEQRFFGSVWVVERDKADCKIYDDVRKVNYVRVTNNGKRFYFFAKEVEGATKLSTEEALSKFIHLLHAIESGGKHVSYSRNWKRLSFSKEKWIDTKVFVSRKAFIGGLQLFGVDCFISGDVAITNRLTKPKEALIAISTFKAKPSVSSLPISVGSLCCTTNSEGNPKPQTKTEFGKAVARSLQAEGIKERIAEVQYNTRQEWMDATPIEEQERAMNEVEKQIQGGIRNPPLPWKRRNEAEEYFAGTVAINQSDHDLDF